MEPTTTLATGLLLAFLFAPTAAAQVSSSVDSVRTDTAFPLPSATPDGYRLGQNIPNPARSITRIPFVSPKAEKILLTMYDSKGREIAWHSLEMAQGMNTIDLDVSTLPPGSYLYQITAGTTVLTRMMTVTP